jgi:hypothetical protein
VFIAGMCGRGALICPGAGCGQRSVDEAAVRPASDHLAAEPVGRAGTDGPHLDPDGPEPDGVEGLGRQRHLGDRVAGQQHGEHDVHCRHGGTQVRVPPGAHGADAEHSNPGPRTVVAMESEVMSGIVVAPVALTLRRPGPMCNAVATPRTRMDGGVPGQG